MIIWIHVKYFCKSNISSHAEICTYVFLWTMKRWEFVLLIIITVLLKAIFLSSDVMRLNNLFYKYGAATHCPKNKSVAIENWVK